MAIQEKFTSVGPDLQPDRSDKRERDSRRIKGARSKMAARGAKNRSLSGFQRQILAATWLGLVFMSIYAMTVGLALFEPGYSFWDRVASGFLLFGLFFIIIHGFGYANSMIKACWGHTAQRTPIFSALGAPRVACLISSFNEPREVLEETVASVMALDYPNKDVFILDDSTKPESREAAQEIARNYGIGCIQRTNRKGYKAGAINEFLPRIEAPYIALFDADALPVAQFLSECVPQIHDNPKLGFLQTPQFYANTQVSYVALASARQQNVFYEYICEGKSFSRAAFCCGTNVIFRRSALQEVGGFNEESVTEDFATSFHLHVAGYDSLYVNKTYAYSLAPENLAAYFTQQSRWSFGTIGTARQFVRQFLKNPRALRAGQWWEYFLSASYYLIGWVNFSFILLPLLYLFFGLKPLRQDVWTYLLVFMPYMLFTLNMFYTGMEARGYKVSEAILGQQIGFLSFPIHMKSALSAFLGQKRPFGVTPKGVGGRISWWTLWPQLLLLVLSLVAFLLGTYRWVTGIDRNTTAVTINSLWALYHVWMLAGIFRLNQPVREGAEKWYFADGSEERGAQPLPDLKTERAPLSVGRVALVVMFLVVAPLGFALSQVLAWNAAPTYPVNVYVVDRSGGLNGQQHRALMWTLNYQKVRKQPSFGPAQGARTHYDENLDYAGFVPNPNAKPVAAPRKDGTGKSDIVTYGFDRPLPPRLAAPGVIYLADTFGEWETRDARSGKTMRFRAARRGLSPSEVDAMETFARRGGLILGEWNTLGYPTRPGNFIPPAQLEIAIDVQRKRIARLSRTGIPAARANLRVAQRSGDFQRIGVARGQLEDARGALIDATYRLRGLQNATISNSINARQGEAATRLERLLRVSYVGWYGRYVENFAEEREYDPKLWKSVRDYLTRRNGGRETLPSGPGFVFYPDGPTRVFDPATGTFKARAFTDSVAILGDELGANFTSDLAVIEKSTDPKIADDPLLQGVKAKVPGRNWFDVVLPAEGARVLATYNLQITPAGAKRLKQAGFPAQYVGSDGKSLRFPAAIAGRDGNVSSGQLRSLYLTGDASGYANISGTTRKFPALGRVEAAFSSQGAFPTQYYWGFYEPMLRGVWHHTPRLAHSVGK
ncbi:MAG TPA: glycosyltransferase [Abditibacterium sp.]